MIRINTKGEAFYLCPKCNQLYKVSGIKTIEEFSVLLSVIETTPVLIPFNYGKPNDSRSIFMALSLTEPTQPDGNCWIDDTVGIEPIDKRYRK